MVFNERIVDDLLGWLAANREIAARKYETIRSGLIRVFVVCRVNMAEDLADEVINSASRSIRQIRTRINNRQGRLL